MLYLHKIFIWYELGAVRLWGESLEKLHNENVSLLEFDIYIKFF